MKTITFTGHRDLALESDKWLTTKLGKWLFKKIEDQVAKQDTIFISGGAIGWDQLAATCVICLGASSRVQLDAYKLIIAEPYPEFWGKWSRHQQDMYMGIKYCCKNIYLISDKKPKQYYEFAKAYQDRNIWMVDKCDEVWAWYDGSSKSGTKNCIEYANKVGKPVINFYKEYYKC